MDRLSELAHQLRAFANEFPLPKLLPEKEVIDLVLLRHPKKPKSATNHAYPPDWLLIERNRSLLRKDIKEFWRLFNKAELTEAEQRVKERKKPELHSSQVTSPSKKPVRAAKRKVKISIMADRYPTTFTPSEESDTETKPAADAEQAPKVLQEKDTEEPAELKKGEPSDTDTSAPEVKKESSGTPAEQTRITHRGGSMEQDSEHPAEIACRDVPVPPGQASAALERQIFPLNPDGVLRASEYYDELDQLAVRTAELCNLEKLVSNGPADDDEDCLQLMKGVLSALDMLKQEGFCSDYFTVFVEDPRRSVAVSRRVYAKEVENLIGTGEKRQSLCQRLSVPDSMSILSATLALGLTSFAVSHSDQPECPVLDGSVREIRITSGLSLSLQPLTCLSDFVGDHLWVVGQKQSKHGLKVSITVEDFGLLWGPLWIHGAVCEIVGCWLAPVTGTSDCNDSEAEYHCVNRFPLDTKGKKPLTETSCLLIGTCHAVDPIASDGIFSVNRACQANVNSIQQNIAMSLRLPGVEKDRYESDGYSAGISGGKFINCSFSKTFKRNKGKTVKDKIFNLLRNDSTTVAAVLEMKVGIIVSACTGNSSRVSLWRAMQLPRNTVCNHPTANRECIGVCLGGLNQEKGETLSNSDSLTRVLELLELLSASGVQHNGTMEVWWPFTAVPQTYTIKCESNRWLPMLKDTIRTCTFAVSTSECLSIRVDGVFAKSCQKGGGKSGFMTTVMGTHDLMMGDKVVVSGLLLTVKKIIKEEDGVMAIAAAGVEILPWGSKKMEEQCLNDLTTGKSFRLIVF